MTTLEQFLVRAEAVLMRLEDLLPEQKAAINWETPTSAFRWKRKNGQGILSPIVHISPISLADLFYVERQKALLEQNTLQFLQGKPANNVLLTGSRGTGKSSLVKALLNQFSAKGLRLIEIDKHDLIDIDEISDLIVSRPEYFILYCDDLSFDQSDSSYKALKVALDGSVSSQPDNILIYATSNLRHLLPEKMSDNAGYSYDETGDLHPSETVEEKISFSDRFGLWLSFYPYNQEEYLFITAHWLKVFGCTENQIVAAKEQALQWALHRGSKSGRTALHFARDYAGKTL